MKIKLSPTLRDAIRKVLEDVEQNNGILDAYKAAEEIQRMHPAENVALEDIVAAMISDRGGIGAIEFDPRRMIIEVVYPLPETDEVDLTDARVSEVSVAQ